MAGGTVFVPVADATASYLDAGRGLTPVQRSGLQAAARALADGTTSARQFCVRAAEICGAPGEAAAARLDEHLAEGVAAEPGMVSLIEEVARGSEVCLVSDYSAAWLLPALARNGLASLFQADKLFYIADLGGLAALFERLVAEGAAIPGHTLWVDAHSPRTSEALRKGIDAAIYVDARRLRRDLGLWRLVALSN
jgi:hypothetical protein